MSKGKYLAIDYGDRRIGLAISDFDKQVSFPRDFLENDQSAIEKLQNLCTEEQVAKVIVGLPIEMDGSMGDRVVKTYQFGDELKKAITPIPVDYFDERLTTKRATSLLRQQGIKEKDAKGQKDMVSAQVILQAYLDANN